MRAFYHNLSIFLLVGVEFAPGANSFKPIYLSYQQKVSSQFYSGLSTRSNDLETSTDDIRNQIKEIIERTWIDVEQIFPPHSLLIMESEIKTVLGLVVLATLKQTADINRHKMLDVDGMFYAADSNGDGLLTLIEWFNWLSANPPVTSIQPLSQNSQSVPKSYSVATATIMQLLTSLQHVLSFATNSLRVASRMSSDPSQMLAAFVAGSIATGYLSKNIYEALLNRLRSDLRELVSTALALESSSLTAPTRSLEYPDAPFPVMQSRTLPAKVTMVGRPTDQSLKQSMARLRHPALATGPEVGSSKLTGGFSRDRASRASDRPRESIPTIDLSSIPLVQAPGIDEPVPSSLTSFPTPVSASIETLAPGRASQFLDEELSEEGFDVTPLQPESPTPIDTSMAMVLSPASNTAPAAEDLTRLLVQAAEISNSIRLLRQSLVDLDEDRASSLRQVLVARGGSNPNMWSLAMALRASRLGHSLALPSALKQSLALDTLQLWVPLSFQLGLSASTPELELHSYSLLYPRSFGSFVAWYGVFKPAARSLLQAFRSELERRLRNDEIMGELCSGVTVQSRLKTPTSAFKKMVKSTKQKSQLHDLIGLRIIVIERQKYTGIQAPLETTVDQKDDASNYIASDEDAKAAVYRVYSALKSIPGWRVVEERVKDYIRKPKSSGYRSLHATLAHPGTGFTLEVQLRTMRMHVEAEEGPASHNNYKAKGKSRSSPIVLRREPPNLLLGPPSQ